MAKNQKRETLADLRAVIARQETRIGDLEQIIEAFSRAEEFSRQELIEADEEIKARENLQSLAEQERLAAEKTIRAQEGVWRLAEQELLDADRTIQAQASLQELAASERIESERTIEAHRHLEHLGTREIKQRDAILAAIVALNGRINSLQPVDDLLQHILIEVCGLFGADQGFIARYAGAEMSPLALFGFEDPRAATEILNQILAKEPVAGIYAPLSREGRTIGILYLECSQGQKCFSSLDRGFIEILASQVSVGFNNSLLYNRLRQQNHEFKRVLMLKKHFIEHLSDDLQQPLNRLVKLVSSGDSTKQGEALELVGWLRKAVDKIFSVVALQQEAEEMYSHNIRLDLMVKEIVQSLKNEIEKREIRVEYDFPEKVFHFDGNHDIVNTILDEVISNAIVYNRRGGLLSIKLIQDTHQCQLIIRDTGVGIKKSERQKVFERFYRAETSPDLHVRGAGLGLYIVRNFIEAYDGSIKLESILGKGTEITLVFPR